MASLLSEYSGLVPTKMELNLPPHLGSVLDLALMTMDITTSSLHDVKSQLPKLSFPESSLLGKWNKHFHILLGREVDCSPVVPGYGAPCEAAQAD